MRSLTPAKARNLRQLVYPAIAGQKSVKVSIDERGRTLDNIFVERLWPTVKYEYVYLQDIKRLKYKFSRVW